MPQPYILDPFQRIIALSRDTYSYAYRTVPCPPFQSGSHIERQTTTIHTNTTGTQTLSTGSWQTYSGVCIPSSAPGGSNGTHSSNGNTYSSYPSLWLHSGGFPPPKNYGLYNWPRDDFILASEFINISIVAKNWQPTGLPYVWGISPVRGSTRYQYDPDATKAYYDLYINDVYYVTTYRYTGVLEFYHQNSNGNEELGGYGGIEGNAGAYHFGVGSLTNLHRVPDNTYYPVGQLAVNGGDPGDEYVPFTVTQGAINNFKCVIRLPYWNYTATIYNWFIWE